MFFGNDFEEWVLKLPRKIDFLLYSCGAGGEFFYSLIVLSCNKTKKLLQNQDFRINDDQEIIRFNSPKYFKRNLDTSLSFMDYTVEHLTAEQLINNVRSILFSSIVTHMRDERTTKAFVNLESVFTSIIKDTLLISRKHFDHARPNDPNYEIDIQEKFEKFSDYHLWDVVNIDPISKAGKRNVLNAKGYYFPHLVNVPFEDKTKFTHIECFPFIDYMIEQDYNSIKYFIENRYGSHLNFDFIDQSLSMYYEKRVKPFI